MVDPERYYEDKLEGKTAAQIRSKIRSLQRKIRQLQKEVDDHDSDGWMICPDPEVQLIMHRQYLQKAKEALAEAKATPAPKDRKNCKEKT